MIKFSHRVLVKAWVGSFFSLWQHIDLFPPGLRTHLSTRKRFTIFCSNRVNSFFKINWASIRAAAFSLGFFLKQSFGQRSHSWWITRGHTLSFRWEVFIHKVTEHWLQVTRSRFHIFAVKNNVQLCSRSFAWNAIFLCSLLSCIVHLYLMGLSFAPAGTITPLWSVFIWASKG